MKFVDQSTYDYTKLDVVEVSHLEDSETEPDQALTIDEILKIHFAGGMVDVGGPALVWPGQSDGFNPEEVAMMDAVDRERFARSTLERAKEQSKKAKEAEDKATADLKEAKRKRLEERRQKLKDEIRQEMAKASPPVAGSEGA